MEKKRIFEWISSILAEVMGAVFLVTAVIGAYAPEEVGLDFNDGSSRAVLIIIAVIALALLVSGDMLSRKYKENGKLRNTKPYSIIIAVIGLLLAVMSIVSLVGGYSLTMLLFLIGSILVILSSLSFIVIKDVPAASPFEDGTKPKKK